MTGTRTHRHNAPASPGREPTVVSGVLLTLGSAAWVMGGAFFVASFGDNNVTADDAGRQLAQLFAATLLLAGTFTFMLGVGLLHGERGKANRYIVPLAVGAAVGTLETVLFFAAAGVLLLAPYALIVLVFHPLRHLPTRVMHRRHERTR